ncbi:NAD(P)-dependent dehydrogenase (short-subunit alcohol dehydrogenase family) [Cryobacterium sp. MP_M5]|uniref:SDR family oxidoreductase n=1 Tax=unclassified Cryobacterium TaxID=2649013 RepID=UPI0018C96048|nr:MULTISPECIES: SDR family oxidoreductase [unclassified Cryobacterium]MBG6057658.1 NAD(P)-dependent dehydrogenase (short-subunit alcohol dehydrogenase family) [Cryobacterium sp. MP_M3]MEC5175827.1 NAD(P)-dependent dehydrogenase (short-subunit alcohol dehydrogenase family) [Cryobacterium sp. MP_M5]
MPRTSVVTGAASGIGKATCDLLREHGQQVIGVDLHDADVTVDLATASGRATLLGEVTALSGGSIDAVLAVAGSAAPVAVTAAVNFFGTVATLETLRPLLLSSPAPRAVAVSSMAALFEPDDTLLAAFLEGDEERALTRAAELVDAGPEQANLIYGTTKRALSRWIRRNAATPPWAGASIPLNAVAPGVVLTPMTAEMTGTVEARNQLAQMVPMPLNGFIEPIAVARLLAWLTSEENTHLCGQIVYIDGGSDVVLRGDSTW